MGEAVKGSCPKRVCFMSSIAIIGPNGQLGTDLVKVFSNAGWDVKEITHQKINIENIDSVRDALIANNSDWIINTAAFHKVDECEVDPGKAWQINATGQLNVATIAHDLKIKSVFISSDYVFSGDKEDGKPYSESDLVSPINAYGHSKAAGEAVTLAANPNNLVVRIASVFGVAGSSGKGGNFVETILKKGRAGETLKVVEDITMSPTYTVDASNRILEAINASWSGLLHASNTGKTTWFDFAQEILKMARIDTELTSNTTNWEQLPKRPRNSSLDTTNADSLSKKNFAWTDGLRKYLVEKGHI